MRPTTKNPKDQKNGMAKFGLILGEVGLCIESMPILDLFVPELLYLYFLE